jgi:hypothetical protein
MTAAMKPLLSLIEPWRLDTSSRVPIRIANGPNAEIYGMDGQPWTPAILERPQITVELMSIDLDGKVQAGRMTIKIGLDNLGTSVAPTALKWIGAPITLWSCNELAWSKRFVEFTGEVTAQRLDLDGMTISLTCTVSISLMEGPLLTREFSGGGGIEGEPEMRGTLWPAGFGAKENIEPVWFDKTRWIGAIDGYNNTIAITRLMEGASDMGAVVADYPSYAALAAAIDDKSIAPGRWGTCFAEGLVGLGAPPVKPIGVNAQFGADRLGILMRRVLTAHRSVPAAKIDKAAFDALDATLPYPVSLWVKDQRDCKAVIEALAASGNATPIVTPQGLITVTRGTRGAPVATLDRSGSQLPRVIGWSSAAPVSPVWKLRARAARPANTLTFDQVNYADDIIDRGLYNPTTTYRTGNYVWLSDKSSWLYIADDATAGNAPPPYTGTGSANAYWQSLTPPATASDLVYGDGTPIENLKPAELGADTTAGNVSAGFFGQGPFATISDLAYGSPLLSGFNILATLPNLAFGSPYLLEQPGGVGATIDAFKTALGIASGFQGQGALASKSAADFFGDLSGIPSLFIDGATNAGTPNVRPRLAYFNYDNGLTGENLRPGEFGANITENRVAAAFTGQGGLATLESVYFGSTLVRETDGGSVVTLENFKTSLGVASSIAGQGTFATVSSAAYGSALLTGFGELAPRSDVYFGSTFVRETSGGAQATLPNFKTSEGIASSISGQGAFATINQAAYGSPLLSGFDILATLPNLVFGSPHLLEAAGGSSATLANFKTSQGIASAITGQKAIATSGSWSDVVESTRPRALQNTAFFPAGYLKSGEVFDNSGNKNLDTYFPETEGANRTQNATAASVFGQGALATKNAANFFSDLNDLPAMFIDSGANGGTANVRPKMAYMLYDDGNSGEGLRPGEVNANKTENRTAAAFQGQAALATLNSVTLNTTTITRADGTTIVSETLVITSVGVASSIAGQGKGATANNLIDLDSDAAQQLANARASSTIKIAPGNSQAITRAVAGNTGHTVTASIYVTASQNGTASVQLQYNSGAGWVNLGDPATTNYASGEPGVADAVQTYTNSSTSSMAIDFRAIVSVGPNANTDPTRSFLSA